MAQFLTLSNGLPKSQTIASADLTSALASPSAIGGTTPNTGKFTTVTTTSFTSTGTNYITASGDGGQILQVTAPNLASGALSMGFGKSIGPGNAVFFAWWGQGFGSLETYGSGSPLALRGNYINCAGLTTINGGGSNSSFGTQCANGIALTVNPGASFTVDTSGNMAAYNCKPQPFASVSLSGSTLSAGQADSTTVSVSGALVGCCVLLNYADGSDPSHGGNADLYGYCASSGTVTVLRRASATLTGTYATSTKTINVRTFN